MTVKVSNSNNLLPPGLGFNVVGGMGIKEGEGCLFLRFGLVNILILSTPLSLESLEKFVWGCVVGGGWWWFVNLF